MVETQAEAVTSAGGRAASAMCEPPPILSVVMPCLNEARTVVACVAKARSFFLRAGISGEVIVADNGSTDRSPELALAAGARVVHVAERGYGAAITILGWLFGIIGTAVAACGYLAIQYLRRRRHEHTTA